MSAGVQLVGVGFVALMPLFQRYAIFLDPTTYASPDGTFELHVDPSQPRGAREGAHTLSKDGHEVWSLELPVTMWEAAVTDSGYVAGYAYSVGLDGRGGTFHVLIIDPDGSVLVDDETKRDQQPRMGHGTPFPKARAIVASETLDAVFVPMNSLEDDPEPWRAYRLSSGERLADVTPENPLGEAGESLYFRHARSLQGVGLTLVQWSYVRYGPHKSRGVIFSLHDELGRIVWSLKRPRDSAVSGAEAEQVARERRIGERNAILKTGEDGAFELWFPSEHEAALFRAARTSSGGWQVTPLARRAHSISEGCPRAVPLRLGAPERVPLKPPPRSDLGPVRAVAAFGFTDAGRIELVGWDWIEERATYVKLTVDGELLLERSIELPARARAGRPMWCKLSGGAWITVVSEVTPDGRRERIVRIEPETGASREIDLPNERVSVLDVAAAPDGGFVVLTTERVDGNPAEILRFDRTGQHRWCVRELDLAEKLHSPSDVTVAEDGSVVVLSALNDEVIVLDEQGGFLYAVELDEIYGEVMGYPREVVADGRAGTFVRNDHVLWRMGLDGERRGWLAPRFQDDSAIKVHHFHVAPDGTVWVTDGVQIMRLGAEGVVDRFIGGPLRVGDLTRPAYAGFDRLGRVHVLDWNTGAVHVFDRSGEQAFVCDVGEERSWITLARGTPIVDARGHLYWPGGSRTHIRFGLDGRRHEDESLGPGEIRSFPDEDGVWLRPSPLSNELERRDASGAVIASVRRRPDERWIKNLRDFAVSMDGSRLALLDARRFGGEESVLCVYDEAGRARSVFQLPGDTRYDSVEVAREWAVVSGSGASPVIVALESGELHELAWERDADPGRWAWAFSPDERQLWGVDVHALQTYRFALPSAPGDR